jgi:hypothetical protein
METAHLVEDGNITGMPTSMHEDIRWAYEIYGSLTEYVWGEITKKNASQAIIDEDLMLDKRKQIYMQSAFCALTFSFLEVVINMGGVSNYVAKADGKIQRIKEIYRTVKAGLK